MRVRLGDEDRKRYELPEWCGFDLRDITLVDLNELSERFGFDPNDWPDPFMGEITLDQAGDPDAKPKPPPWRNQALMWMILRQNGCDVTWEQAAHTKPMMAIWESDPEPERGKDSTAEPASPKLATSTTPRSSTSGRASSRTRKQTST